MAVGLSVIKYWRNKKTMVATAGYQTRKGGNIAQLPAFILRHQYTEHLSGLQLGLPFGAGGNVLHQLTGSQSHQKVRRVAKRTCEQLGQPHIAWQVVELVKHCLLAVGLQ